VPTRINGLPAHVLLVHAVVFLVPLAALLLLASAWSSTARRKLGLLTPLVALIALILVPVTTHAGEWLRDRVPATPLVNRHAELGDQLLPWAVAMFLVAVLVWYVDVGPRLPGRLGEGARRLQPDRDEPATAPAGAAQTATLTAAPARVSAVTMVAALLATVLAVGSVVQVVRIGESGSKAVWQGNVSSQPHQLPGDR
jgi:hypothetical protein